MATPEVIVKCEELLENEMNVDANNTFGMYENAERPPNVNNENHRNNDSDDDRKMQELLREFDLEELYTILKFGDITYRSLKYISENDINAAIRSIAYRAEFREKLFAWRRDKFGFNDISVLPVHRTNISSSTPLRPNNDSNILPTSSRPNSKKNIAKTSAKQTADKPLRSRSISSTKISNAKVARFSNQIPNFPQTTHPPSAASSPNASNCITDPCTTIPHLQHLSSHAPTPSTPTSMDALSFLQTEIASHPIMDYDDPLCFQATTSSAAAATASAATRAAIMPESAFLHQMDFDQECHPETGNKRSRTCTEYGWSKEKTEQLIELYQQHQDLWNPASEFYRDHVYKQKILKNISSDLGISVTNVSAKIHNLRCQYNAVLRRIRQLQKKAGTDNILHTPRWEYYNSLKFLSTIKRSLNSSKLSNFDSIDEGNASFNSVDMDTSSRKYDIKTRTCKETRSS